MADGQMRLYIRKELFTWTAVNVITISMDRSEYNYSRHGPQ